MTDYKTAPGVILNDTEQKIVQKAANFCDGHFSRAFGGLSTQIVFQEQIQENLGINWSDTLLFTLC